MGKSRREGEGDLGTHLSQHPALSRLFKRGQLSLRWYLSPVGAVTANRAVGLGLACIRFRGLGVGLDDGVRGGGPGGSGGRAVGATVAGGGGATVAAAFGAPLR